MALIGCKHAGVNRLHCSTERTLSSGAVMSCRCVRPSVLCTSGCGVLIVQHFYSVLCPVFAYHPLVYLLPASVGGWHVEAPCQRWPCVCTQTRPWPSWQYENLYKHPHPQSPTMQSSDAISSASIDTSAHSHKPPCLSVAKTRTKTDMQAVLPQRVQCACTCVLPWGGGAGGPCTVPT